MLIVHFVKAIAKHWWALMSCAVFTFLAIYAAWKHKANAWIVTSSIVAGIALFVCATFLAWKDERNRSDELTHKLTEAEEKLRTVPSSDLQLAYARPGLGSEAEFLAVKGMGKGCIYRLKVCDINYGNFSAQFNELAFSEQPTTDWPQSSNNSSTKKALIEGVMGAPGSSDDPHWTVTIPVRVRFRTTDYEFEYSYDLQVRPFLKTAVFSFKSKSVLGRVSSGAVVQQ